jgi:hypothetical protein
MSLALNQIEIPPLKRLGTHYSSMTNVHARLEPGIVQLVSAPISLAALLLWIICTASLMFLFVYATWPQATIQMGPLAAPLYAAMVALTLIGPVVMSYFHNSKCARENPYLDLDMNKNIVTVRNAQNSFPLSNVHALVAAAIPDSDGGILAELQLFIRRDDELIVELVCTRYSSSSRRAFGKALSAIATHCPFPAFIVEPTGFFRRGPMARIQL